jgi:HEPN domain-containing protein
MSAEKRSAQAKRWCATAGDDLQSAEILYKNGKFPQSCFFSQQAGEKSLKALCFLFDVEPWGHSLLKLAKEFNQPEDVRVGLGAFIKEFRELDRYYIPTRYPDGLPGTTPAEAYGGPDAESALKAAARILTFVKNHMETR